MGIEELIALGPTKVRADRKLMQLYIDLFTAAFSVPPDCAGCTFNRDWNKLKGVYTKKNIRLHHKTIAMDYKIQPKYRATILTYLKNNRPIRTYGKNMTDDFAREFLKNGTPEQLAERRKMFISVPNEKSQAPQGKKTGPETPAKIQDEPPVPSDLARMSRADLDLLAELSGLDPKDYPNKASIIKALK